MLYYFCIFIFLIYLYIKKYTCIYLLTFNKHVHNCFYIKSGILIYLVIVFNNNCSGEIF